MNNTKVLHIIHCLGNGGAARSTIATAKYSSELGSFEHIVMSLDPAKPDAMAMVKSAGITVINSPDSPTLIQAIENADIVQFHFWNNPQIYEFLRLELPPMRLVIWFHIAGDNPPQVITKELVGFADCAIACNPYSSELPVFQSLPTEIRLSKTGMVYDAADFARLTDIKPQPHETFNVGYIGSVNFAKMHPNYVPMSSKINVPNIRFIVCGGDKQSYFKQQAGLIGTADRFEFRGFVENITSVLEILDVYGYPLCPDTYAAAELNLQEAMYAGIPPVVFPYGGIKRLVMDNYTGLVVNSELEYQQAVEYLYHYPEERARIGKNAQEYARQIFGAENAAKKINQIYENLLKQPKRDRQWGTLYGYPQIDQPVTLKDVTGESENISGAELFIQALGETAPEFKISLTSDNVAELLSADQKIAQASMLLATGEGGISQYREYDEKDGYLRLWWALYLQEQGSYGKAVSELIAAIDLGCNHWRVVWYLAQAAVKINQISLAKKAVTDVLQAVPDFAEAKTLLEYIESISEPESWTADRQQELAHQLRLRNINLIIFPDWTASEDALLDELATAIGAIATHPDKNNMTLLVDSTNISDDDADMAVSSIVMNLMLEQELDLESGPDICVIGQLSKIQWQALLPRIHGRIVLELENKEAIAYAKLQEISVWQIDRLTVI
jgi:glycosyltransferase involved in cell wall biosynthesis